MSADYSSVQPRPKIRKGLAVASLVLGLISIPTLGMLAVGAITAIVLGAIALGRIRKEPAIYGGKRIAIAGIITGAVSLLLIPVFGGILASVAIPQLIEARATQREAAAIQILRIIHINQITYMASKGRFGALKELNDAGFIDSNYANGSPVSGYIFTSVPEITKDKYCVQATRQSSSSASRDFNIDQDGIIRFVESKIPGPLACGEGTPIADIQ